MEEAVTSWDIEVGDIISKRGIISERWDEHHPDMGAYFNELCRYIVLEKVCKSPDNPPSMETNATKFYFKVAYLYALPEIREATMNAPTYILTDWEIDTEDYEEFSTYYCEDTGFEKPVTPREWVKLK